MVRQIDELDVSKIRKISAASEKAESNKTLRVAAYCRVSTDDIDQAISIELQMRQYKEKIKSNPDWKYAGTYVDNGFSGTNTAHRPGFLKLIEDARAGKIDMIITKAVLRFARNLLDCIGYIEELKNLDPPVRVFFEQENLDTGLQTSGIILFVLAMVAEEESHMKSEAMLLFLEWRFSRGRFLTPSLFGYDKVEIPDSYGGKRKMLQINHQQAQVVKWLYAALLNGSSTEEIAGVLTELQIPTVGRKKDDTLAVSVVALITLPTCWLSGVSPHPTIAPARERTIPITASFLIIFIFFSSVYVTFFMSLVFLILSKKNVRKLDEISAKILYQIYEKAFQK